MDIVRGLTGSEDGMQSLAKYSNVLLPKLCHLLGDPKVNNSFPYYLLMVFCSCVFLPLTPGLASIYWLCSICVTYGVKIFSKSLKFREEIDPVTMGYLATWRFLGLKPLR